MTMTSSKGISGRAKDADGGAKDDGDEHGDKTDGKRDLAGGNHAHQHVAADLVGAKRKAQRGAKVLGLDCFDDGQFGGVPQVRADDHGDDQNGQDRQTKGRATMGAELLPDRAQLAVRAGLGGGGVSHNGSLGQESHTAHRQSG
jgi:hypothetical protein